MKQNSFYVQMTLFLVQIMTLGEDQETTDK